MPCPLGALLMLGGFLHLLVTVPSGLSISCFWRFSGHALVAGLPSATSMRCKNCFPVVIQSRLSWVLLGTGHGRAGAWKPRLLAPLPTPLLIYGAKGQILMALGHLKAQKDA